MGAWSADSKTTVATMGKDDFFSNEKSVTVPERHEREDRVRRQPMAATTVLKEKTPLKAGEIIDATVMSRKALVAFLEQQIAERQGGGRALLAAPEGHDDEGLRPDHLRPRRAGFLQGPLRQARRDVSANSAST